MIDLDGLSCDCHNEALETLSKAISEDQHDIWSVHENPFLTKLLEMFTDRGLNSINKVNTELGAWLSNHRYTGKPSAPLDGMMQIWNKDELGLVRIYLESIPQSEWQLDDYSLLIDYLHQRYLNPAELKTDAEWLVTKSHLMGKAQSALETINPHTAGLLLEALPSTVASAAVVFNMANAEKQILDYAKLKSMDMVTSASDAAKHDLKTVLLDHLNKKFSGDETATPRKLQQSLFDHFSTQNRDWRRLGLTEAGNACNEGFIASLPINSKVKRIEQYHGACGWCKAIDGQIFNLVSADDPNKNGDTDIWPGKSNIGRSASPRKRTEDGLELRDKSECWWVAAGLQHPCCRGRWFVVSEAKKGYNADFTQWFNEKFN
jgi:hypothetical protein